MDNEIVCRAAIGARTDEEAAIDACVASTESEGRRHARISKIDKVMIVDAAASDWIVRGEFR